MSLKCGIVGLPNIGKSTLFNALTKTASAQAANYPFCTIEPNVGIVAVPDSRLEKLAALASSEKVIPASMEFVDIAGLVKGASKGEGLGNKFLSHIREVDAILHVLRCFDDEDITHVSNSVDPIRDKEIIDTELIIADLEVVERRLSAIEKKYISGDKSLKGEYDALKKASELLDQGIALQGAENFDASHIKSLNLLTLKPVLYVLNVLEGDVKAGNKHVKTLQAAIGDENDGSITICAKIEEEIAQLEPDEQEEFLRELAMSESGLDRIIKESYRLLSLRSFFTAGKKEARSWTYKDGASAPECAGVIHTDFEKGFIRAQVTSYNDYISCEGEEGAKTQGKTRTEGKDYKVQDGDVIYFRFNV